MNNVVKFENSKKRSLNWEQEEANRGAKKAHRDRRDQRKHRGIEESNDE